MICLFESYLDASVSSDNDNLNRADQTGNVKRGGVYVYFKESLTVRCLPNSYLKEFHPFHWLKKSDYSSLHFVLIIGGFNAKSSSWWSSNDRTTAEDTQLDYLTSLYGMKQVITKPTNILESSASRIGLIFVNQPNMVMDSGLHSSLLEKCPYQIIYSKLNLKIEYLLPYSRKI